MSGGPENKSTGFLPTSHEDNERRAAALAANDSGVAARNKQEIERLNNNFGDSNLLPSSHEAQEARAAALAAHDAAAKEAKAAKAAEAAAKKAARAAEPKKPSLFSRLGAALGDATKAITNAVLGGTPEERAAKEASRKARDARQNEAEDNRGAGPRPVITDEQREASLAAGIANTAARNDRLIEAEKNRGSTEPGQGSRADTARHTEQTEAVVAAVQQSQGSRAPTPPTTPKGQGLKRSRSESSQSAGRG